MYQGQEHGRLIGWVVVQLCIQIQVGMGGFPVYPVPQEAIWSSVYANIQERKVAILLSLHGELDDEVVEEVTQFFRSMGPGHNIHVMEPTCGLEGHPAECHLLKVFHEEVGNGRWQWWTQANFVCSKNWPLKQKKDEVRMWWNCLTSPFPNYQLRRFKESPVSGLLKRGITSKVNRMTLSWTQRVFSVQIKSSKFLTWCGKLS